MHPVMHIELLTIPSSLLVHDWVLVFVQIPREFTETPPGYSDWGLQPSGGGQDLASFPELVVGMRVEGFYETGALDDGAAALETTTAGKPQGEWFPGSVSEKIAERTWKVLFDDGDISSYQCLDNKELRLAVSWSWKCWLDTYLPALLTSAYRAARRAGTDSITRMANLDPVLHPQDFMDCVLSSSSPPGQAIAKRRRRQA